MDTSKNHLVRDLYDVPEAAKYERVPSHLQAEARRLMGHGDEAHVPRSGASPLTQWAAARRRDRRDATRAQQKASRRRNR